MAKRTIKNKKKKKIVKPTVKKTVKKATKKVAPKKTKKPAPKKIAPKGILADVEHLMQMMAENDVTEIDIDAAGRKISLKRGMFVPPSNGSPVAAFTPASPAAHAEASPVEEDTPPDNLIDIVSPMVGTFYTAPSPDSDAFATPGDTINPNTVVCIIEAMKVMNEIKAECAGTIAEICVKNAEPVEFGQVMFRVKPA
jgi:acetyl-CoA carboxylase biotin carboxyl carrier protein